MHQQHALPIVLAAVWGICATWIFSWLLVPALGALFWASEPALKSLLQNGWTGDQIRPYFQGVTTALQALFYGLIFGFPLGLLTKRSLIATWAVFVAAFLVTLALRMLFDQADISSLVENFAYPLYWLILLATLLFSFLGHRVRSAYVIHHAAA